MSDSLGTTASDRRNRFSSMDLRDMFLRWEWLLVALIIVMTLVNTRLSPFFLNTGNLLRTASDFVEIGIMVLPMAYIIITGNIDLSVASTLALSASLMGWMFMNGWNIWIAAVAALLAGALAGLLNGVLVARLRLPSLVVTLGTLSFYRGLAYALLGDQAARGYPASFTYLGQGTLGNTRIPFSLLLLLVLALIFGLVLHKTTFGRYLYAMGNNEEAARYSGVPVARIKIIIFVLAGLMAALAGLILAARFGSTRPDIGLGLELTVITVTVLGGINIFGGSGTMIGAVLALLLIGIMRFGMGLMNIQGQVQTIVIGLLLILSILLPNLGGRLSTRGLVQRDLLRWSVGALAASLFFAIFFFWSRSLILTP
ncbi:MAG: ABC transporter permease [Chloroflexota bacterium]|nr:ABC transporter permease [Chloroflexota bacterium]